MTDKVMDTLEITNFTINRVKASPVQRNLLPGIELGNI